MQDDLDRYTALNSWLHRWDPRWKIAGFLLLLLMLIIERPGMRSAPDPGRDLPPACGSLALALLLLISSRIPITHALKKLRPALWFLLALLIVLPLMYPGERIPVGSLGLSTAGIIVALVIVSRALAIILLAFLAFNTTRFDSTMKALHGLKFPAPLVQIALFAYRFLFVSSEQYRRMRVAMRARGFRPRANLNTLRIMGNNVGMLLVQSVERVQRIHGAMKSRGHSGTFRILEEFHTEPRDVLCFLGLLLPGIALLLWRLS